MICVLLFYFPTTLLIVVLVFFIIILVIYLFFFFIILAFLFLIMFMFIYHPPIVVIIINDDVLTLRGRDGRVERLRFSLNERGRGHRRCETVKGRGRIEKITTACLAFAGPFSHSTADTDSMILVHSSCHLFAVGETRLTSCVALLSAR
jgi:hypothetical protein